MQSCICFTPVSITSCCVMRVWSLATRSLFLRVLAKVLIVLVTIEVVFLAEELTGILEQVLGNGGDVLSAVFILLLSSPEIFDFALALACVIGGYFAFVAAREEREMVALSAAGVSSAAFCMSLSPPSSSALAAAPAACTCCRVN